MDNETQFEGKFLKIIMSDNRWQWVTRNGCNGACVIVPITTNDELVIVEQFRYPAGCNAIEFPAGLVADIDKEETALLSAQRELEEETGYLASAMSDGTPMYSSVGLTDEITTVFVAYGCEKVSEGGGDETENITVHTVPVKDFHKWIAEQRAQGKAISSNLYYGISFIRDYLL
jgi:ADP-ribose pyrophosphatase